MSRWAEPTQTPLAHWPHPIRPPPLSLPGTYPFSAHTPSPEAVVPGHLHPLPQTKAILYPSLVFSRWPGQVREGIITFRQSCPRKLLRNRPPQGTWERSEAQSSVASVPGWRKSCIRTDQRRSQRVWRPVSFEWDPWAASDWKAWLETSEIFEGLAAEYWPTVPTLTIIPTAYIKNAHKINLMWNSVCLRVLWEWGLRGFSWCGRMNWVGLCCLTRIQDS